MKEKVVLVRCDSYDRDKVKAAITKAIDALGGFEEIFAERTVGDKTLPALSRDSLLVLKPNLLGRATPEKAMTTHPEVFRAVGELLQERGYGNLKYGDSPGNPILNTENTAAACGIKAEAEDLGIAVGNFDKGVEVRFPEGRITNKFMLCREVVGILDNGDNAGIINLCKMKTHQLTRITGALKNTFGCVYGLNKAAFHAKCPTPETFSKMIADLNRLVVPRLHIMDGIVAMEGNGPGSGDPVEMNVILAATDPVALDAVFCHLIDLNPDLVPTHVAGCEAGIGAGDDADISVIAIDVPMIPDGKELTLDEAAAKCGNSRFNVQRSKDHRGAINWIKPLAGILEKKPIIVRDRCVGCGVCIKSCPVEGKAIAMGPDKTPVYDYGKCIKCYCCQEMCPEKAIKVRKSLFAIIFDRKWRI